ncbi:imm11 family protein [Phenylobacterium montanum]|uniref:Immunity MXAN-0049 protein domain-containing protein n=1 Tax=Phenylobacterium montanum TaxID=2823693 RepID=A0A975FZQ7_9CAUL|nr:DUF1629 domain-containing protein [Caulobacter sp. S6]QUD88255.1 hypothetical protein KCG34_25035 [Caulobacter sp. S6]
MTNIYRMKAKFSTDLALAVGGSDDLPLIELSYNVRRGEGKNFQLSMYQRVKMKPPKLAAELVLRKEDFDFDYFQWGPTVLVSERMRQVMALDAATARYLEVDSSRSAPLPRSKNYKILEPEADEDVSDLERSEYEMVQFMPGLPSTPSLYGHLVVRTDTEPRHELFYDAFFTADIFCTEAFALRVLRAGCTGVEFGVLNEGEHRLCRTLRGIERVRGYDEARQEIMELV